MALFRYSAHYRIPTLSVLLEFTFLSHYILKLSANNPCWPSRLCYYSNGYFKKSTKVLIPSEGHQ